METIADETFRLNAGVCVIAPGMLKNVNHLIADFSLSPMRRQTPLAITHSPDSKSSKGWPCKPEWHGNPPCLLKIKYSLFSIYSEFCIY